jgi:hypothetical protein
MNMGLQPFSILHSQFLSLQSAIQIPSESTIRGTLYAAYNLISGFRQGSWVLCGRGKLVVPPLGERARHNRTKAARRTVELS